MARWKLTEDHYINAQMYGEPTEWEQKETDRTTGREMRKRFKVPLYCESGLIVCYEGSEQPTDNGYMVDRNMFYRPVTFEGPPTPSMEPLDDEAKAISDKHKASWVHPIESLSGNFNVEALMQGWGREMAALAAKAPMPVAESGVTRAEFEALQEQMKALMARNAELEGTLDEPELPVPPPTSAPKRSELRR